MARELGPDLFYVHARPEWRLFFLDVLLYPDAKCRVGVTEKSTFPEVVIQGGPTKSRPRKSRLFRYTYSTFRIRYLDDDSPCEANRRRGTRIRNVEYV